MHKKELGLTVLSIIALGASVNFLILGTAGVIQFSDYRNYILLPSLFIILFIVVYAQRKNKRLANRLLVGLLIGILATGALEAIRIPSIYIQWIPHDDMIALPGKLLTNPPSTQDFNAMLNPHGETKTADDQDKMNDHGGQSTNSSSMQENESTHTKTSEKRSDEMMNDSSQPSTLETVVGGLYHYWNGATMAAVYTLVVGKGRWWYGLIWGFIVEVGMMLAPWMLPMVGPFGINYGTGYTIFTASLLAHLAYGAVLGVLAQRFVKEKGSIATLRRQQQTVQ